MLFTNGSSDRMAQTSWWTHCCILAPRRGLPCPISPESFSPSARSQPALLDSCTHARHRGSPLCEHRACTAVARLHPACEEGRAEFLAGVAEKCSWCVCWDGAWKSAPLIYSASMGFLLLLVVVGAVRGDEGGLAHLRWTPVVDR